MSDTPTISGVTPYLSIDGVRKAIDFYIKAFDAKEVDLRPTDDGTRFMHAHIAVNGAAVFMSDFFPEYGFPVVAPQGFNLHLQVDDAQAWYDRALAAGCEIVQPLKLEFWGDYYSQVKDPFGIVWAIGQTGKK